MVVRRCRPTCATTPSTTAGPAKTPTGTASGSFGRPRPGGWTYVEQFQAVGGSKVMLAKGNRSKVVTAACQEHGGFYLGLIGGPAARLAQDCIRSVEVLEYAELGMEAVWKIEVEDFPAFIVVDDKGNDFFTDPAATATVPLSGIRVWLDGSALTSAEPRLARLDSDRLAPACGVQLGVHRSPRCCARSCRRRRLPWAMALLLLLDAQQTEDVVLTVRAGRGRARPCTGTAGRAVAKYDATRAVRAAPKTMPPPTVPQWRRGPPRRRTP